MENHRLSLMELGIMVQALYRAIKKRTGEQDPELVRISPEQFSLLHAIADKEEEVIQKDMAEMMAKDKSAILRLIDSLEEKGLVRRVVDPKDRRKNYLIVTKVGFRVKDQYLKLVHKLIEDIQQGLTPSEIETFHKVICQIRSNAEKL